MQSKHMDSGVAQHKVRAPLAEVAPPTAPPSWEQPVNPRQQMEPNDDYSASRGVHRPPRPPMGYAGVDDPNAYVYGEEPVARAAEMPALQPHESTRVSLVASARSSAHMSRACPELIAPEPSVYSEPEPELPRMINSLQREALERRDARDAALAAGRGGQSAQAFSGNATDPFIAHQLAKLGVNPEKYQEAMQLAAAERTEALAAAKAHGRGNQLVGVMDGYGGASSFKGRKEGDYYDEDYGEYFPEAPQVAAGAAKPVPLERHTVTTPLETVKGTRNNSDSFSSQTSNQTTPQITTPTQNFIEGWHRFDAPTPVNGAPGVSTSVASSTHTVTPSSGTQADNASRQRTQFDAAMRSLSIDK